MELSIVLVILGLLIGGVLTGQSLIRAAELRSVTTQEARYLAAIQTFRDKYFALPGDMTNGVAYWGAADGSTGQTTACKTAVGTGTKTCNGNGNGAIDIQTFSNEMFRFWQEMANAGLIEGNYTGVQGGTSGNDNVADTTNSPVGRISSSMWNIYYWGPQAGNFDMFDGQYGNALMLGGVVSNNVPYGPVFKPEEAYNIDMKMDDGKPATGGVVVEVVALSLSACTDAGATATSTLTANYALNKTALSCALMFRNLF